MDVNVARGEGDRLHIPPKHHFYFITKFILLKFSHFFCSVPSRHFLVPIPTIKYVTTYLVFRGTQWGSLLLCFPSLFTLPRGELFAVISFVICVIQWRDPLQWLPCLFTLPN